MGISKYGTNLITIFFGLFRWVIDFNEIQLGKQIGLGSYGLVYRFFSSLPLFTLHKFRN